MSRSILKTPIDFVELIELEALIRRGDPLLRWQIVSNVPCQDTLLPIYCLELGSIAPDVPVIGFFGGVHGLERIGTQILLSYLHTFIERLQWDNFFKEQLEHVRLVFMPLINPGGMWQATRCNPQGVDLMRNAPVEAEGSVPWLLGGHRLSPKLPWFRGKTQDSMQPEAQALVYVVEEKLLNSPFSISLDCHSGFGHQDRLWFPYARTKTPISHLPEMFTWKELFQRVHPRHDYYIIEPQSRSYSTHGDLWDFLYDLSIKRGRGMYLPLTLELGSWKWLAKNPSNLFSYLGFFNPVQPHRKQRILRRHQTLMDFLLASARSYQSWLPKPEDLARQLERGMREWYW